MNQEYIYDDEPTGEGLTFKKIGYFFKRGWLRMAIYLVIAALLTTAIAVPIKMFYKSEPVAQTSIEFIYEGIEKGQDPSGAPIDEGNIISTIVLAQAVENANLGDVVNDITTLRNAMRVESVLTDEYVQLSNAAANGDATAADKLRDYDMFPTRFNIVISHPSDLGLSDEQSRLLLNKVVASYYDNFKERYSVRSMFPENAYNLSENDSLEFADIYDIYLQSLESVKTFLQQMSEDSSNFISTATNTSFAQLLNNISVLSSNYNQFNAYILSSNIWRNTETAKNALEASKLDINNRLEPLQEYIVGLTQQIKNIQPNTTTSDSAGGTHTLTVSYPAEYFVYQNRLDEANRQVREYNVQLKNIETRLENLKMDTATDETLKSQAVARLAIIEAQTTEVIKKVNATVTDFYDTKFVSSSVRQVQPPIVTRKSMGFSLLLVYAIAFIAALLVAGIVTGIMIARSKEKAVKTNGKKPADTDEAADNTSER